MIKRKMLQVASITTLGVIGLVLLSRGGPECACSLPASSFSQQTAEEPGDALRSPESANNSRIVSSEQAAEGQEATPLLQVKDVKLAHGVAQGLAVYRANGKPLAILIRAERGAIVCMHFSLDALEGHRVPAASVQGIQSFEKLAENKIVRVNHLASALGVQAGMSVREALDKMMEKGISGNTVKEDHAIPTGPASRGTQ